MARPTPVTKVNDLQVVVRQTQMLRSRINKSPLAWDGTSYSCYTEEHFDSL